MKIKKLLELLERIFYFNSNEDIMKIKVRNWSLIMVFAFFIFFVRNLDAQDDKLNDSLFFKAVLDGYNKYSNLIPIGKEIDFGFKNRAELKQIKFGPAIHEIGIDSTFIDNCWKTKIEYKKLWYVPILVEYRISCFLEISQNGSSFVAVGLGLKELAQDVYIFIEQNKLNNNFGGIFVDFSSDFVCIPKDISMDTTSYLVIRKGIYKNKIHKSEIFASELPQLIRNIK